MHTMHCASAASNKIIAMHANLPSAHLSSMIWGQAPLETSVRFSFCCL